MKKDIEKDALEDLTRGGIIGGKVHFLDSIDSTNNYATLLASRGAYEGEVVISDCQTAGRGRLRGRVWHSPPGVNLYTSVILRPDVAPESAPGLTLVAGVAVAELLNLYCPVSLKWPNDILANGKKISGILTEMRGFGSKIDFVVIGIGINVNMDPSNIEEGIRSVSTSLKEQTSKDISRLELAAALYCSLGKWYRVFIEDGFASVRDSWLQSSDMVGKMVEVTGGGCDFPQRGICKGIDDEGILMLLDDENRTVYVRSGDINIKKGR